MRKSSVSMSGLLALALLAVLLAGCTTAQAAPEVAQAAESQGLSRYITVVGSGKVSLVPDIAEVNVGAEVAADTVSEAKAEVDSRMEAIMAASKSWASPTRTFRRLTTASITSGNPSTRCRERKFQLNLKGHTASPTC